MNFFNAIKHAAINYGIRRKAWPKDMILHLDNAGELRWLEHRLYKWTTGHAICKIDIHGGDGAIGVEDMNSTDWETV